MYPLYCVLLFNRGVDVKFFSVRSLLNIDTLFFMSDKYIVRVVSSYATAVKATASPMLAWPIGVLLRAKKSISLPITTAKSVKERTNKAFGKKFCKMK